MTDQTPASAPVPAQDTLDDPGRQPDAPETAQTAVEGRTAQSGVDTPGCDCGHEGMGVGWHGTDCAWRARTTPDKPATSGDAADNPLREQYAAAIGAVWDGWIDAWVDVDVSDPEGVLADAVLAVRDRELERLEKLHQAHLRVEARLAGGSLVAEAAVERIRLLIAAYRPRLTLADPILLAKLDRALEQPAELEAAAGERP